MIRKCASNATEIIFLSAARFLASLTPFSPRVMKLSNDGEEIRKRRGRRNAIIMCISQEASINNKKRMYMISVVVCVCDVANHKFPTESSSINK